MGVAAQMHKSRLGLGRFREPIVDVFDRSRQIDLREYESAPAGRLATVLRPAVCVLLGDARTLLSDVLDACGDDPEDTNEECGSRVLRSSYLPFEHAVDATMVSKHGSARLVDEVAFIAQLELRERLERLERARIEHGTILLLGEADSSLRRIRKALSAVEAAIARTEGERPVLAFTSETDLSVRVRRAYARFRAGLDVEREPDPSRLHARLRGAGTEIAMLIGRNVYPELRVRDRLVLRDLQERILSWLRAGRSATVTDGMRLWQDLAACVSMFALINRRQELVEHDAHQIPRVLERLRITDGEIDSETQAMLESLWGLDRELDDVLTAQPAPSCSAFIEPLERLDQSFECIRSRTGSTRPPW